MTDQKRAYIYALITVALWSTIASASKISLRYLRPAELLFVATLVSIFVLLLILVSQKKIGQLVVLTKKDWVRSFQYGFLNPFLYYLILFKAYDLLPAQQAQIINYTWAITLTLLSIPFLGQKVAKMQWLAIVVSYFGVFVIATRGNLLGMSFDNPRGVVFALASTVIWALYWILNTKDGRDPVIGIFLNFICALPFIILYMLLTEGLRILPIQGVAGAAYIGVCEMAVGFVLWLKAMKYTDNTAKIANLIFIAPFASLVFIYFLVGEKIYPSTYAGLIFVVTGLVIQSFTRKD